MLKIIDLYWHKNMNKIKRRKFFVYNIIFNKSSQKKEEKIQATKSEKKTTTLNKLKRTKKKQKKRLDNCLCCFDVSLPLKA